MNTKHLPLDVIRNRAMPWRTPGICPLAVSNKLKAIRELREPALAEQLNAEPRLAELLWFLQWRSHQPGGLDKFTQEFLLEFPERLSTAAMCEIPWPRKGHYALDECVRIWGELPRNRRDYVQDVFQREAARLAESADTIRGLRSGDQSAAASPPRLSVAERIDTADGDLKTVARDLANLLKGDYSELRKIDPERHPNAKWMVNTLTPEFFWQHCAESALERLPQLLSALCVEGQMGLSQSPWYFARLIPALIEMMDRHAARENDSIARTSVSEAIMDRFAFAVEMRANVLLAGDARLGKSVSLESASRMWPGRCRLVTVPSGNSQAEFIEAHSKPFCLSLPKGGTQRESAEAVGQLVRESGLFIAYDEFHFAIPARAPKNSNPPRLDWIRTHVVDAKRGVIFSTTRQAYGEALSKFLKHTQWAVEQWAGRLDLCESFGCDHDDPNAEPVLSREDVLSIAAHKFPSIDPRVLEHIASEAYGTNAAPHVIESLLKAATWIARKAGRPHPSADDARQAVVDWKGQARHESFEVGGRNVPGGKLPPPIKATAPALNGRPQGKDSPALPAAGLLAAVGPQVGRRVAADEHPAPVNRLSARTPTALVGG